MATKTRPTPYRYLIALLLLAILAAGLRLPAAAESLTISRPSSASGARPGQPAADESLLTSRLFGASGTGLGQLAAIESFLSASLLSPGQQLVCIAPERVSVIANIRDASYQPYRMPQTIASGRRERWQSASLPLAGLLLILLCTLIAHSHFYVRSHHARRQSLLRAITYIHRQDGKKRFTVSTI